eukprot:3667221-Rhodomonas_salina.1
MRQRVGKHVETDVRYVQTGSGLGGSGGLRAGHGSEGTEGFLAEAAHGRLDVGEDGGIKEVSLSAH